MEAIVINSDSEDEKNPNKLANRSNLSPTCRACKGICGSPDNMPLLPPPTSQTPLDALFPRSRLRAPKRPLQTLVELFPVIEDVNREFRAMLGKEHSETNIMKFMQFYIRTMRKLQEQVHKYPNKCRALSRNVCRTLLLIKKMSTNVIETPYYMQKICELLAIYMFLELRYASSYAEAKAKAVERIVNNILLHLESPDITYVLRIFAYIPFVGKEAYIVSRVFQRLIPIVVSGTKNEFNDRLYVQYLIAFYHWKDAETLPNCQENVIALANAFMKPKRSLKSSIVYARHLPCYEKRENATRYFLTNLVFFNDLRNASLLDGVAVMVDDTIDLSDELETLCTDYSDLELNKGEDQLRDIVKQESVPRLAGTVDLTDEDETPWLTSLARTARDRELQLPTTQRKSTPEVIDLDSSDEESCAVGNQKQVASTSKSTQNNGEGDAVESVRTAQRTCSNDVFFDSSDESTSDVLIRAAITESTASECETATEDRLTFDGFMDQDFDTLRLSPSPLISSLTASESAGEELNASLSTISAGTSGRSNCENLSSVAESANSLTAMNESSVAKANMTKTSNASGRDTSFASTVSTKAHPSASTSLSGSSLSDSASTNTIQNTSRFETRQVPELESSVEVTDNAQSQEKVCAIVPDILTSPKSDAKVGVSSVEQMEVSTIGESTIDASTAAPKEAVTLNLESYTNSFICGEENDEFLRYYETTPPVKTYLRKTAKKLEAQVQKEDENRKSDRNLDESTTLPPSTSSTPATETGTIEKDTQALPEHEDDIVPLAQATATDHHDKFAGEQQSEPVLMQNEKVGYGGGQVLFSRRVISLREDESTSGRVTPNYLKVPESVEVSSHGSNVVFSMQGRRLSSFPAFQVSSPSHHAMPDFDADIFSEGEETSQPARKPIAPPAATMLPKTIIKPTDVDNESEAIVRKKPATQKRRTVWFSDKNEVREFAPRDELSEFAIQSSLINISASINTLSTTKQQFLPSSSATQQQQHQQTLSSPSTTPSHQQQSTINAYKSPSTTATSTSTSAINSILLKKSMPPATATTASDTASLKSAQEKDPHTSEEDNRTDDVLAAAEILANGIRLVQTIAQPDCSGGEGGGGGAAAAAGAPPPPSPPLAPESLAASAPLPSPLPSSSSSSDENKSKAGKSRSEIQTNRNVLKSDAVPVKRNVPIMASPTGSDGNDSLLEGFVPIRRPRNESIDDYEQFYRCHYSPSNMKRLLSEGGHISLPLKKRRKLSEYSEENDLIENYDNDTVLNLKMPRTEVPVEQPKQTPKTVHTMEKDLKEISYPSEPMLSIAHFEKDGYREKSKDLSLKRQYPPVPPPRYSDVVRDCRPMVAHQQGFFQHPEQSLQPPNPNSALSQGISARPTINIVTARHTDHFGTINIINQENGTINIVTEENRDVNATTTNVFSSTQPVTNVNVGYQNANNMPAFVGPNAIQYSQAFLPKQQNCLYNVQSRPAPAPTPEHMPPDFELQSIINLQNYHMNQTHINNFLHNRQINFQAKKSIMNDALCGSSYQPNGAHNCTDSGTPESSSSSSSSPGGQCKSTLIPRCGFCVDCKRRMSGMKISSDLNTNSAQMSEESSEAGLSSPPRRRGRPRKPFAEPTNRVTRSTNRAGQKKREDPCTDQFIFHVSETKSPSSAKKRRSVSSYRSK